MDLSSELELRQLAALVAMVSLALVGVAIAILMSAWKGPERKFLSLSSSERRVLGKHVLVWLAVVLLAMTVVGVANVYFPSRREDALLGIIMLAIAIGVFTFVTDILRRKRRKRGRQPQKVDVLLFFYFWAPMLLSVSVVFSLLALHFASTIMLAVVPEVDPNDFRYCMWVLRYAIFLFASGTWMFGAAFMELRRRGG